MTQTNHNTGSSPSVTEHAADGQERDGAGVLLAPETLPVQSGSVQQVTGLTAYFWLKIAD